VKLVLGVIGALTILMVTAYIAFDGPLCDAAKLTCFDFNADHFLLAGALFVACAFLIIPSIRMIPRIKDLK
jgi:hypothetical protein